MICKILKRILQRVATWNTAAVTRLFSTPYLCRDARTFTLLVASVARNFGSKRVDMPVQIRTNSKRETLGCSPVSFSCFFGRFPVFPFVFSVCSSGRSLWPSIWANEIGIDRGSLVDVFCCMCKYFNWYPCALSGRITVVCSMSPNTPFFPPPIMPRSTASYAKLLGFNPRFVSCLLKTTHQTRNSLTGPSASSDYMCTSFSQGL